MILIIILLLFIIIFLNLIHSDQIEENYDNGNGNGNENGSSDDILGKNGLIDSSVGITLDEQILDDKSYPRLNWSDNPRDEEGDPSPYVSYARIPIRSKSGSPTTQFTLSYVFKLDNIEDYNTGNKIILYSQGNLLVYIQNYNLMFDNGSDTFKISPNLFENHAKFFAEDEDGDDTLDKLSGFFHFAVAVNSKSILIFLDGEQRTYTLEELNLNNDMFKQPIYIGSQNDTIMRKGSKILLFNGEMIDIELSYTFKSSSILCDMWTSCGGGCEYDAVCKTPGCTRKTCYDECIEFDLCNDNDCWNKCTTEWTACDYTPYGTDAKSCYNNCKNNHKECGTLSCIEICNNCTDKTACPWIVDPFTDDNTSVYNNDPFVIYDSNKPCPPKIQIHPSKSKVEVTWYTPELLNKETGKFILNKNAPKDALAKDLYIRDPRIQTYVFILYKTYKREEGTKLGIWNMNPLLFQNKHVQTIDNLDPNEYYTLGIKAYRPSNDIPKSADSILTDYKNEIDLKNSDDNHFSPLSNEFTFKPINGPQGHLHFKQKPKQPPESCDALAKKEAKTDNPEPPN